MIQSQHCQPKFRPLPVWCLQHIYSANSSVLQTVYMWLLRPRHVCPAEIFNGPLRVQSKFSLVCGLQCITEKKDKLACDPMQKPLVFPSGLHLCASGISVSFLTAVSSEQSFSPSSPYLLSHSDFYPPIVLFKHALLPNVPLCVVLLYFALDAKQVVWPFGFYLGLFKRQPIHTDLKARKVMRPGCEYEEKTPLLHVCVKLLFCFWCISCLF